MKRAISVILDVVLVLASVFLLAVSSVKGICAEVVTEALVAQAVNSMATDDIQMIFPDVTQGQIKEAADMIGRDENLRALAGDYIDALADATLNGTAFSSPDVSAYMEKAVDDNIDALAEAFGTEPGTVQGAVLKTAAVSLGDQLETELEEASDEALSNMTEDQKQLVEIYGFLTSEQARTGAAVIVCVCAFGIVLLRLSKGRFLFHLGLCGIAAGAVAGFVFPALLMEAGKELGREIAGSTIMISTDTLVSSGKWILTAGVVFFVLYGIWRLFDIGGKKMRYRK